MIFLTETKCKTCFIYVGFNCKRKKWGKKCLEICAIKAGGGHTGQVGDHTTCSQNEHVGEFLYFKLPNLLVQVKSSAIKDVTKYVLNTNVQFTN